MTAVLTPDIDLGGRLAIVVLTHNRREQVLATLGRLSSLPERCRIWVVDNGSTDGTPAALAQRFPHVGLVRLMHNLGAAGRNAGVRAAGTPYVAFCDDDTWWAPGALACATSLLDRYPRVAVLSARVLVGPDEREDPACRAMAGSPLHQPGLPGPLLLGFLAGACVMRTQAFLQVGGYHQRMFLGAEEALVALDLAVRGWSVVYAQELRAHHHPAPRADASLRARRLARNALWVAWMRRPVRSALRETLAVLRRCRGMRHAVAAACAALAGLPWVLRERRALPARVERMRQVIDGWEGP
jgi:GT2 family glycosyltransferase